MSQSTTPLRDIPPPMRQPVSLPTRSFGQTSRKDLWWVGPLLVFLGFSTFIVYSTWAAFQGEHYTHGPYLSPFYSPLLLGGEGEHHGWFGPKPGWWPGWLPFSAALLILWAPGGFRFTCYYYRGAYYKAFWADPISCAVGEPRKTYRGEKSLPAHPAERSPLLPVPRPGVPRAAHLRRAAGDVVRQSRDGKREFGIGVGTIVLPSMSSCCRATRSAATRFRHLIGGKRDEISKSPACIPPTSASAALTAGTCCSRG